MEEGRVYAGEEVSGLLKQLWWTQKTVSGLMCRNLAHTHVCIHAQADTHEHTHMLKRSQKMWKMSTWALHEIKRINPCNMHDEYDEYVEGKKSS